MWPGRRAVDGEARYSLREAWLPSRCVAEEAEAPFLAGSVSPPPPRIRAEPNKALKHTIAPSATIPFARRA